MDVIVGHYCKVAVVHNEYLISFHRNSSQILKSLYNAYTKDELLAMIIL